ncbi:MAG: iron ABC transporter permease [Candidatus Bathyarchaeia archaeon]
MKVVKQYLKEPVVLFLTLLMIILLILFVAYPMISMLQTSFFENGKFTTYYYSKLLTDRGLYISIPNSFRVSIISTVFAVIIGFLLAYTIARTNVPGKTFISMAALIPLVAPPYISALSMILLFGPNGLLLKTKIYGMWGIILAQTFSWLPVAFLMIYSTFVSIPVSLEDAGATLGANGSYVFRTITIPLMMPALVSAFLTLFMLNMADFGNPIIIGGGYSVLATRIFIEVEGLQRFGAASVLGVLLLAIAVPAYLLSKYSTRKSYAIITGKPSKIEPKPTKPIIKYTLGAFSYGVVAFILLIYATVIYGSFVKIWGYDFTFTTKNYYTLTMGGMGVVWTSFKVAITAALITGFLGLIIAWLLVKKNPPAKHFFEYLTLTPLIIPGTVMGLGYAIAFNKSPLLLTGTLWILILSVVFRELPVAVLSNESVLKQISSSLEDASASLGGGTLRTLFKIIFPLARNGFFSGFVYTFMQGMITLSAVVFLFTGKTMLASIAIVFQAEAGRIGYACALSTVLIATVLASLIIFRILAGKKGLEMFSFGIGG